MNYRNNGAIGALLDEYEKAISELKTVIKPLSHAQLTEIVDPETTDEDCRSIQTILSHVLRSGYYYAITCRKWKGEEVEYPQNALLNSSLEYIAALDEMFIYNENLFKDYPSIKLEEYKAEKKMLTRWGQLYDVEQIYEHAIVHILRHRRQIERFIIKQNERQPID